MTQTQLPASFAGVLSMATGQTMNLGSPITPLDGSKAFTLTGWFQVSHPPANFSLLQQGNNFFSMFFAGTSPGVSLGQYQVTSSVSITGVAVQLGVVYTPPGPNGDGKLQLFLDGAPAESIPVPTAPSGGSATADLIVGNASHWVGVRRLWLTSTPLTEEEMVYTRFGATGTALTPLQSTWDWGEIPAVIIGAPEPVPYRNAAPSVVIPGLVPSTSGSATATLPQGTSFAEGTVQGWFFFPSTISSSAAGKSQTLFQMGTSSSQIALSTTPNSNGQWTLQTTLGATSFQATLAQGGWHNLAVTWSSGTSGTLYVDGQHSSQHGDGVTANLSASTVYIGNTPSGGHGFLGVIQNVVLWNTRLSAQDVNVQMKPWFPITNTNPVAFYDFTQPPCMDVVSGTAVTLRGGAYFEHGAWTASAVAPSLQMLVTRPAPERPLCSLRPQRPLKPNPALWTSEREAVLLKELRELLAKGASDPRVKALGDSLEAKLKAQFARGRAGNPDLTGLVRTERQGNELVTFYYDKEGPRAILRLSDAEVASTPCTEWMIDFVATSMFGLLDIMGIPLTMGVGVKAIRKLLGRAPIWEAVSEVVEGAISTSTITGIISAFSQNGGLRAFVDAVLNSVAWWDFLFMVLEVMVELLALLLPGSPAAFIVLAKCILLVAQLGVLESERPAGCP